MRLIVYAGANGAGKSTLRAGGVDPVEVEIDPDRIARELNPADPRAVDMAAGKEALRRFDRAIAGGRSLSLETTLTGSTVLKRMRAAKEAGFRVTLRYVALHDPELHIDRVRARVVRGGHWIDPSTVLRRVAGSLENLPTAVAIADYTLLYDNTGFRHKRVLEIQDGQISFQVADLPPWLADQLPRITTAVERVPF